MAAINPDASYTTALVGGHLYVGAAAEQFGESAANERWPLSVTAPAEGSGWLRFTTLKANTVQEGWQISSQGGGLNVVEAGTGPAAGAGSSRLFLQAGGNVGIGIDTPGARLDVRGDIRAEKLTVGGALSVSGDTTITGGLAVRGAQNLIKVATTTLAVVNAGKDTPASWRFDYAGQFTEVYAAYVVLQGFSLWPNTDPRFGAYGHVKEPAGAFTQHVFVRIVSYDNNAATGVAYCSEAEPTWELDNSVLFTVVVMGRKV
jgi:hypothetical protein